MACDSEVRRHLQVSVTVVAVVALSSFLLAECSAQPVAFDLWNPLLRAQACSGHSHVREVVAGPRLRESHVPVLSNSFELGTFFELCRYTNVVIVGTPHLHFLYSLFDGWDTQTELLWIPPSVDKAHVFQNLVRESQLRISPSAQIAVYDANDFPQPLNDYSPHDAIFLWHDDHLSFLPPASRESSARASSESPDSANARVSGSHSSHEPTSESATVNGGASESEMPATDHPDPRDGTASGMDSGTLHTISLEELELSWDTLAPGGLLAGGISNITSATTEQLHTFLSWLQNFSRTKSASYSFCMPRQGDVLLWAIRRPFLRSGSQDTDSCDSSSSPSDVQARADPVTSSSTETLVENSNAASGVRIAPSWDSDAEWANSETARSELMSTSFVRATDWSEMAKSLRIAMPRSGTRFHMKRGHPEMPLKILFYLNDPGISPTGRYATLYVNDQLATIIDQVHVRVASDEVRVREGPLHLRLSLNDADGSVLEEITSDVMILPEAPQPEPTLLDGVDHVFVCHWAALTARRDLLNKTLQDIGLEDRQVTWITEFDRDTVTQAEINRFYQPTEAAWRERYDWHRPGSVWRNLSIGEICVTACHIRAYEMMTEKGLNGAMVLEDDTRFVDNFAPRWNEYMERLRQMHPDGWDMLFFGAGNGNTWDPPDGVPKFEPVAHPASRTAGSYVISGHAAQTLYHTMVPFATVSDGELDYQMWMNSLRPFWALPHLAWEGTKGPDKLFKSVVDPQRWKTEKQAYKVHRGLPVAGT